ncbi:hypothetical protein J3R30DRAFT_3698713 [Lentinula aciculospora]|uniref:Uncharacterized protein n=1 Tax=Lentinula aciculospora TaxID=153920 RepID=A0A9W9DS24_9AGAR|nr:hypothetical protein J3R30DRAFT_3698713 [Lentinula aciculospora]
MAASSGDGNATTRTMQTSSNSESVNSPQATLESLINTLSKLEMEFKAVNASQHPETNDLEQTGNSTNRKAHQLNEEVLEYKQVHVDKINGIKTRIRETYPNEVAEQLRPDIQSHVKAAVLALTKNELKTQFGGLMPIPLKQQLDETNEQLSRAKNAFINSEARSFNSTVDIVDSVTRDDQLKLVLKPDGMKSDFWPADLNSLFAYDSESVKKLLKDYKLPIDKTHNTNINCFLGHIGIKQQLV